METDHTLRYLKCNKDKGGSYIYSPLTVKITAFADEKNWHRFPQKLSCSQKQIK